MYASSLEHGPKGKAKAWMCVHTTWCKADSTALGADVFTLSINNFHLHTQARKHEPDALSKQQCVLLHYRVMLGLPVMFECPTAVTLAKLHNHHVKSNPTSTSASSSSF